jgi:uncharacterized protein with GYD domain
MSTYLLFGKYNADSIKAISSERTKAAENVIHANGGSYHSGYALLGDVDLVLIVDLPDTERALQTSAELTRLLGISFSTAPAVNVEDFDRLMG